MADTPAPGVASADGLVFAPPAPVRVAVHGGGRFPVRRIFCVGKNYAAHVAEMGGDARRDAPVFFTKPADAIVGSGEVLPYPPATNDLHYEGELVVALGAGGQALPDRRAAQALIFGHAAGCDLTRRDLQAAAKKAGGPWDAAKAFDASAPIGPIGTLRDFPADELYTADLRLLVNGGLRQNAPLSGMIWSVPEVLIALSQVFALSAGDLVFTGTPAGVGPLRPGDAVDITVGALPPLRFSVGQPRTHTEGYVA